MSSPAYFERPFSHRLGALGDKAEGVFLEQHPQAHRLGLNRPAMSVSKIISPIRYTPDFALEDGFYEVMGFSSRGNAALKLKLEKAAALQRWAMIAPTYLWVYDSGAKRAWCAPVDQWVDACGTFAERAFFEDNGRPYWNLPYQDFPTEPVAV